MDKYLLEILKLVNTIIIPNLGALTITDSDSGDIMFMSYLKHDDGKLATHIAEKEGWEENDAKNLISKYVREILSDLDKGEEYVMYQFGTFYKDGDDIQFKNWNTKENTIVTPEVKEVKEETKIVPTGKPEQELNIVEKEAKAATIEKLNQLKKDKEENEKNKKKGISFWVGIGLLVLLIGGGIAAALNFDYLKQTLPFLADNNDINSKEDNSGNYQAEDESTDLILEPEEPVLDEVETEELIIEEDNLSEPEVTDLANEEPIIESPIDISKPYNIIAGAFSSEGNAIKLVDKLKSLGHPATFKKKNGMHIVSAKSFASKEEARTALSELKNDVPGGWISKW